jgi:hypothetical protein
MLFREIMAVYSHYHTKCEQDGARGNASVCAVPKFLQIFCKIFTIF